MTHKQYPVRFAEMVVKGDKDKLVDYLSKNEKHFQTEYGILRTRLCGDNPTIHHVRVEFPICEVDGRATKKFFEIIKEMEKEGLKCNEVTDIESDMADADSFPYRKIGNEIWKRFGREGAYEIGEEESSHG